MVPAGPEFREAKDDRREKMAAVNVLEAELRDARRRLYGLER